MLVLEEGDTVVLEVHCNWTGPMAQSLEVERLLHGVVAIGCSQWMLHRSVVADLCLAAAVASECAVLVLAAQCVSFGISAAVVVVDSYYVDWSFGERVVVDTERGSFRSFH